MPPTVAVVVNPTAGRGKAMRVLSALQTALRARGVDFHTLLSDGPDDPVRLAERAAKEGASVVCAVGGDGLVGAVAGGLAHTDTAIAVVAAGTGNDFVRALGGRRSPAEVAASVANPVIRTIDLGIAETTAGRRWFANVANVGFDATVANRANELPGSPGTLRYVAALAATLPRFNPISFEVAFDDDPRTVDAMLIAVANGTTYGGGMQVAPDAEVDDGMFDVCIVGAMGRGRFLASFPKVFAGRHVTHPEVRMLRVRSVRILGPAGIAAGLDGESFGMTPLSFEVDPGALRVVAG